MRFRLLNFAFLAIACVSLRLNAQSLEPSEFGYRGKLQGLQRSRIAAWDIRPDGRYLFFSSGGSSWSALDLQDGVTVGGVSPATQGRVYSLYAESATRLWALTSDGIQYFNITKPFDPEEESNKYELPDSTAEVTAACVDTNKRAYFLMHSSSESSDSIVRSVLNRANAQTLRWSSIFSSNSDEYTPIAIRCLTDGALVFASKNEDDREKLFIAKVSSSLVASTPFDVDSQYDDYRVKDFHLSTDRSRLMLLLENRDSTGRDTDDAVVANLSTSALARVTPVRLGSDPRSLGVFLKGTTPMAGFFIAKDLIESSSNPPTHQFLSIEQSNLSGSPTFGDDHGIGKDGIGALFSGERDPFSSKWLVTDKDVYSYGLSEATGISLISRAPYLRLVTEPEDTLVSESTILNFTITADEDVDYKVYFDSNLNVDGTSAGLSAAPGKVVKSGSFSSGANQEISIDVGDLQLEKVGDYSLIVTARRRGAAAGDANFPTARLGIPMEFNPDPKAVKDFRVGFGDQSVTVFFKPREAVDNISHYYVYFSTLPTDLETLPTTEAELEGMTKLHRTLRTVTGNTIRSPLKFSVTDWRGKYRLGPIENLKTVYFRVQVVNKRGKFSNENPEALAETPFPTQRLSQAFGSDRSCGASVIAEYTIFSSLWAFLSVLALLWLRRRLISNEIRTKG